MEFQLEKPEALEWAFREFFMGNLADAQGNVSGRFFPKPAEINALLKRYKARTAKQRRDDEQKQMLDENRETRARLEAEGQPAGLAQLHDVLKECCERVKKMP